MSFVNQQMARTPCHLLGESTLFQGPRLLHSDELGYFLLFSPQMLLQLELY